MFTAISVNQLKSKYFFIRLKMDENSRNFPIQLFIYLEGDLNPLKVFEQAQIDSCYLSQEQMKTNTNILLLASSVGKTYEFTLRTYWSGLQHLIPNSESKFYFSQKNQSQFYHLELNNTNFHQLRIILKPETIRSTFDKVRIYGSFGHNSTPSEGNYDFKSIHLWEDAEGVFLYGKEVKEKNINLLIVGEIQTVYILKCEIVQKEQHQLQLGETLHQYLEPGQQFTYHADFLKDSQVNELKQLQFESYAATFSQLVQTLSLQREQLTAKTTTIETSFTTITTLEFQLTDNRSKSIFLRHRSRKNTSISKISLLALWRKLP